MLKERLNILGKLGCILCVLGSTVMVIHSPKEQEIHDLDELVTKMKEPGIVPFVQIIFFFLCSPNTGFGHSQILTVHDFVSLQCILVCYNFAGRYSPFPNAALQNDGTVQFGLF